MVYTMLFSAEQNQSQPKPRTQSGASGESATQRLSCDGFHRALAQLGPGVAIVTNWE